MKPVDQKYLHDPDNGSTGDCMRASVASVLELPIEEVPHFALKPARECTADYVRFLAERGYAVYCTYGEDGMASHPEILPGEHEYYFGVGPSPRDKNVTHQVVCHKGKVVHDPHPDKTELDGMNYFEILLKL